MQKLANKEFGCTRCATILGSLRLIRLAIIRRDLENSFDRERSNRYIPPNKEPTQRFESLACRRGAHILQSVMSVNANLNLGLEERMDVSSILRGCYHGRMLLAAVAMSRHRSVQVSGWLRASFGNAERCYKNIEEDML